MLVCARGKWEALRTGEKLEGFFKAFVESPWFATWCSSCCPGHPEHCSASAVCGACLQAVHSRDILCHRPIHPRGAAGMWQGRAAGHCFRAAGHCLQACIPVHANEIVPNLLACPCMSKQVADRQPSGHACVQVHASLSACMHVCLHTCDECVNIYARLIWHTCRDSTGVPFLRSGCAS